jgi:hypothetical protein
LNTAEHGRFDGTGGAWNRVGGLTTTDSTIKVVNGVLIKLPATTAEDQADFGAHPDGTFTVSSQADWDAAKAAITNGGDNKNYVITVDGNFTVPGTSGAAFGTATGITVSLRGSGTLSLSSNGSLIHLAAYQTVILRDLTLQGRSGNNNNLVNATSSTGAFVMHSGTITGNTTSGSGAGVWVAYGTFDMYGGTITGNTAGTYGGGVRVEYGGTFTVHGGTISNNTANGSGGGGVYNAATFRFVAGTIYGNEAAVDEGLRNNAAMGAALYASSGIAERGTFAADGTTWIPDETLATRNETIQ